MTSRSQVEADRAFAMELANLESGQVGSPGKKKKGRLAANKDRAGGHGPPPVPGSAEARGKAPKARSSEPPKNNKTPGATRKGRLSIALPEREDLVRSRSQHQSGGPAGGDDANLLTRMTSYFALPEDVQKKAHVPRGSVFALSRTESGRVQTLGKTPSGNVFSFGKTEDGRMFKEDWAIARALQKMEFEIESDMNMADDFNNKEYAGSLCWRQMCTLSTLLLVLQIGILAMMIWDDGMEDVDINPMYGPPAVTLVRYGAKEAAMMKYDDQWWRLLTPIMLHAGVMHMLTNGCIQLRVGGYLNLLFGTPKWFFIYFAAGVYGTMASVVFLPETVGVGASGALLGNLSAWLVWIFFRWNKIPEDKRSQRNCQLVVVLAALTVTLVTSFAKYVDFAAHFGGAVHGGLWAMVLLSYELENPETKFMVRLVGLIILALTWAGTTYWMVYEIHPSEANTELWEANDDWTETFDKLGI